MRQTTPAFFQTTRRRAAARDLHRLINGANNIANANGLKRRGQ
jgi:hypothetical protein